MAKYRLLWQCIITCALLFIHNMLATPGSASKEQNVYTSTEYFEIIPRKHHVVRRAIEEEKAPFNHSYQCDTKGLPNPSPEFPVILFKNINYNNCTGSGFYLKLRPGQYHRWSVNKDDKRVRNIIFGSMLMLPGLNVTFRGCCPSGNIFIKQVTDWQSTPDMNHSVFYKNDLSSTSGIWYQGWLYWDTSFYIKVDEGQDFSISDSCGSACYFGQCGMAGKCECASGYSGSQCEIRPATDSYPTQEYPLVLFKNTDFEGSFVKVKPDTYNVFATNRQNSRINEYQSMRVLYNRTVIFSRNNVFTATLTIGVDIEDISYFMRGNIDLANIIWFYYDYGMDADFSVKVVGNTNCNNCSLSHGSCYTGSCKCLSGYSGQNCDVPP